MPSWATAMREPSGDHASEPWAAPLMISRDAPVATSNTCTPPCAAYAKSIPSGDHAKSDTGATGSSTPFPVTTFPVTGSI